MRHALAFTGLVLAFIVCAGAFNAGVWLLDGWVKGKTRKGLTMLNMLWFPITDSLREASEEIEEARRGHFRN